MVLESILNPKNAQNKPLHVLIISCIYSVLAMFFAYQLFPSQSSILSIAMITIIFVPFFQRLFVIEEKKEDAASHKKTDNLLGRHKNIIIIFSAFFIGIIISTSFVFIFMKMNGVFYLQEGWFGSQNIPVTGGVTANFSTYFMNNSQVMILTFVLSVMFGAGAIFILAWNASVIGVYIGLLTQSLINKGLSSGVAYIQGLPIGLASIALHGIPEIGAYFVAGLSGGILSVGIIREKINSKEFRKIVKDSLILLVIAEFLIIVAAWLEITF